VICSKSELGKYEFRIILQFRIEWKFVGAYRGYVETELKGNMNRTILKLIIQLIYFTVCSFIYRICSDRT